MASGAASAELDFASVQRDNPEMERRCQEVIDRCWALGEANPISFIHDVGAGGLSNALPEIIHDAGRGGRFELRNVPSDEKGMSPLEIWCNESQERYVLAVSDSNLNKFTEICERERCPFAVVGKASEKEHLELNDSHFDNKPIDIPMDVLFGKAPKMHRSEETKQGEGDLLDLSTIALDEAAKRLLSLPTIAEKTFLITIGDRSVTGLVARDQLVGPWQVPVSNVAVTASAYDSHCGEAMSMGERAPIALLDYGASARMAVAEAITNLMAAQVDDLKKVKLSANWQAAAAHPGEGAGLYEAVEAIGMELCPQLGLAIPVGKDSMSMKTTWKEEGEDKSVTSPLSLVISAFSPVSDVRKTLTPLLRQKTDSELLLIDLGRKQNRLGASCLAQVYSKLGQVPADLDDADLLKAMFQSVQTLAKDSKLMAYHDRSDGGLFVTLCEMAFAGKVGLEIDLDNLGFETTSILFSEELGAVIQVAKDDLELVMSVFRENDLDEHVHRIGHITDSEEINFYFEGEKVLSNTRTNYRDMWAQTTFRMQSLRDNPECALMEHKAKLDPKDPGLNVELSFDINERITSELKDRPRVAILREQGVNGQLEMAAAFDRAGFSAIDVHMSDLLTKRVDLKDFRGLVACGGFSYGDVLGAGEGCRDYPSYPTQEICLRNFSREKTVSHSVCVTAVRCYRILSQSFQVQRTGLNL